jgi:hypothetical protein
MKYRFAPAANFFLCLRASARRPIRSARATLAKVFTFIAVPERRRHYYLINLSLFSGGERERESARRAKSVVSPQRFDFCAGSCRGGGGAGKSHLHTWAHCAVSADNQQHHERHQSALLQQNKVKSQNILIHQVPYFFLQSLKVPN